jgi:hypothetical protein
VSAVGSWALAGSRDVGAVPLSLGVEAGLWNARDEVFLRAGSWHAGAALGLGSRWSLWNGPVVLAPGVETFLRLHFDGALTPGGGLLLDVHANPVAPGLTGGAELTLDGWVGPRWAPETRVERGWEVAVRLRVGWRRYD